MPVGRAAFRLTAATLIALGASACAWTPEPTGATTQTRACYWMTPDGSRWEPMTQFSTKSACAAMDSCNGGGGGSGGGCYKWATSPKAVGETWSD